VTPDFEGVSVWADAVIRCPDVDAWVRALSSQRGVRSRPDSTLRDWALAQTAERQNSLLWERLRALGVAGPPT
jgi:hypothetical protein